MRCSPAWSICRQPSHSSGVPVLVTDLLLHLRIRQSLQEWRPDVRLALVSERILHCRHLVLGEDIALAVVSQLTTNGIEDSSHKLSSETEVTTQFLGEFFRIIVLIREIPLKLINLKLRIKLLH